MIRTNMLYAYAHTFVSKPNVKMKLNFKLTAEMIVSRDRRAERNSEMSMVLQKVNDFDVARKGEQRIKMCKEYENINQQIRNAIAFVEQRKSCYKQIFFISYVKHCFLQKMSKGTKGRRTSEPIE